MRWVAFLLIGVLSTGCATIMTGGGPTQSVSFQSEPRGANVVVDGNEIGKTPIAADLTRKDMHIVTMDLNGDVQTVTIVRGANLWVFGNILFGGLPGIIVDCCTGSLDGALNPNHVKCKFAPLPAAYVNPTNYAPAQPTPPAQSDDVMKP
jgi:PEGA domain